MPEGGSSGAHGGGRASSSAPGTPAPASSPPATADPPPSFPEPPCPGRGPRGGHSGNIPGLVRGLLLGIPEGPLAHSCCVPASPARPAVPPSRSHRPTPADEGAAWGRLLGPQQRCYREAPPPDARRLRLCLIGKGGPSGSPGQQGPTSRGRQLLLDSGQRCVVCPMSPTRLTGF